MFLLISGTISVIIYIISHFLGKSLAERRSRKRRELKIPEEQYKRNLMENYGVIRDKVNKKRLICPVCGTFGNKNNVCPTCNRKL